MAKASGAALGELGKMPRPTGAASCFVGSKPGQGASPGNLRRAPARGDQTFAFDAESDNR